MDKLTGNKHFQKMQRTENCRGAKFICDGECLLYCIKVLNKTLIRYSVLFSGEYVNLVMYHHSLACSCMAIVLFNGSVYAIFRVVGSLSNRQDFSFQIHVCGHRTNVKRKAD